MATKLYVGGLAYTITDKELEELFAEQGAVVSATVIKDRDSGQSKGFGFVEMSDIKEAQEAIKNGAADYIPKPFESKKILDSLKQVLNY